MSWTASPVISWNIKSQTPKHKKDFLTEVLFTLKNQNPSRQGHLNFSFFILHLF